MEKSGLERRLFRFLEAGEDWRTGETRRRSLDFFSLPPRTNTRDDNDVGFPVAHTVLRSRIRIFPLVLMITVHRNCIYSGDISRLPPSQ